MDEEVVDNPEEKRFELAVGDTIAVAYYRVEDGRFILLHTEVPQELTGQGIESRLARGVFEAVRASGKRAIAKCPFMSAYAAHHPEYLKLLDG